MGEDSFVKITHQSWFERIGNSIKGILFGILLVIGSIILLFWNEGRAVKMIKALQEGAKTVISVSEQIVDPLNEGKLIHIKGFATSEGKVEDPEFGVSAEAIKLKRKVQMYQWKEGKERRTRKKIGGGTETRTTYNYNKVWASNLIDSSKFEYPDGHQNPKNLPYQTKIFTANKVSLGAFTLSEGLLKQMNSYEKLIVDESNKANAVESIVDKLKIYDGEYYIGKDPFSPEIGDIRVGYEIVKPATVSIIAEQSGNSFKPYMTKVGNKLEILRVGNYSAEEMFKQARQSNIVITWILRFVGFILMGIGFCLILAPLSVFADVIPLLGDIVGFGTSIVAFLLATTISLLTVAIGWIFYRPMLGIIMIIGAFVPMLFFMIAKNN